MTATASTTPTRALRAGLIGLGSMGRNHARTLASLSGVNFVAVCDPARDAVGAALGRSVVGSVEDLVRTGLDYCVVAAPTGLHEAIGLQLAEAGVHMLVEKPVAGDSAAAGRLVEAFARAGLVGAVGHIERYNPALQSPGRASSRGTSVRSTRSPPVARDRSPHGSRTSASLSTWPRTTST